MNKKRIIFSAIIILMFFSFSSVYAKITVVSTKGSVAYKTGRKWMPLKKGMNLRKGTKISTGVKSYAVIKMNRSTVKVRPLSMIKIYENSTRKNTTRTRIGLKRGRVRAQVTRGKRVKTIFKISTPVATSSVRGTIEEVGTSLYGTSFHAPEGSFDVTPKNGHSNIIYGKLAYKRRSGTSEGDPLIDDPGVSAGDDNITEAERDGLEYNGDDMIGGPDDPVDAFNRQNGPSVVNLELNWPG